MLTSIGRLTLLALLASLTLTGCGSVAKLLRPDAGNVTAEPAAVTTMSPPAVVDTPAPPATAGVAGFWDPARDYWHIEASPADFGQTLGKWGTKPGPYLVLPLLPPMTVRDGVGLGVDGATSPMTYFVAPFFWDGFGLKGGDTVNDRAQNIDLYDGFEESVVDMYSAVRNGYLRKREQRIKE